MACYAWRFFKRAAAAHRPWRYSLACFRPRARMRFAVFLT